MSDQPSDTFLADLAQWRARRLQDLAADDGWLNLTDRIEVAPGRHSLGRDPSNDLVLAAGPAHLGALSVSYGGTAVLHPADGGPDLPFLPVPDASPQLRHAGLILELSQVNSTHALRVRQTEGPARDGLARLAYFDADPAWVIQADWLPHASPLRQEIELINGASTFVTVTHAARFTHQGQSFSLLATHIKGGKPMFVFRDGTSGQETYAPGRFLIAEPATGDRITLDFNRAFNPPCAFTPFAICPLPPRQNLLPFRIPAGERSRLPA